MKLNEILEHQFIARKRRRPQVSCFPNANEIFAIEVESTHTERLVQVLRSIAGDPVAGNSMVCTASVFAVPDASTHWKAQQSSLILTTFNVATHNDIPTDCLRYISRNFRVPRCCHDPSSIASSSDFEQLLLPDPQTSISSQKPIILKLQTHPKDLEPLLAEMILTSVESQGCMSGHRRSLQLQKSGQTHLLQCIFLKDDGIFRYGITTTEDTILHRLTFDSIAAKISADTDASMARMGSSGCAGININATGTMDFTDEQVLVGHQQQQPGNKFSPASRAYYKMKEIVEYHLPIWGWKWPGGDGNSMCVAVDVGASPGGWTQCMSSLCEYVVAVDPGLLNNDVLALPNVIHIKSTIQASDAQNELSKYSKPFSTSINKAADHTADEDVTVRRPFLRVLVCDINVDARSASELLAASVLPHMIEACRCNCNCNNYTTSDMIITEDSSLLCSCGGVLVLTLKLTKRSKDRQINAAVDAAKASLAPLTCWDFRIVHLGANSINERTLVCRIGGRMSTANYPQSTSTSAAKVTRDCS